MHLSYARLCARIITTVDIYGKRCHHDRVASWREDVSGRWPATIGIVVPQLTSPQKEIRDIDPKLLEVIALENGLDINAVKMIAARLVAGLSVGLAPDACWPWHGAIGHAGRGVIYFTSGGRRHTITAARAVVALRGEAPFLGREMVGRHTCDQPWCMNPAHVVSGTQKQNIADMLERGRKFVNGPRRPETKARQRVLTDEQVRLIRMDPRPLWAVAETYNISLSAVSKIRNRKAKTLVPD